MRKRKFIWAAALLVIFTLVVTSCQPVGAKTDSPIAPTEPQPSPTSADETEPPTTENSPSESTPLEPTPTPIVETRLPPERWQEWPVIPELTGRERAIYQLGLSLGNDPTHFSKVGDCQTISESMLGLYDHPERYFFTESDAYLQETVDHFSGSFDRDGEGVRGGFNAAAVLSPLWADPEACQPGESPIECEDRIHNPSFALISLEVWWEGRTVERYEAYMRRIIEFFIENGVVPILSTKADNVEGDHRINLATARLAYEYHIPLWNFWLAVQPMPNHGIDPDRDGFHISYEAWTVRSYTALQALDAVWRGVRDQEAAAQVPSATPAVTANFKPLDIQPTLSQRPIPSDHQRLIFSIEQRSGEATTSGGVFGYDLAEQTLHQILPNGYALEDVNPSGDQLLVSQGEQLLLSDLSGETQTLSEQFVPLQRTPSAYWLPDGDSILALTEDSGTRQLWLVNLAEDSWQLVAEGDIIGILKPTSQSTFYWYQGICENGDSCEAVTLWRSQNGVTEAFADHATAAFAFDGSAYAWTETTEDATLILYTRQADQTGQDFQYLPGNRSVDLNWSPVDKRLTLLTVTRSDYSGKSSDARVFIIDANTLSFLEYYAFPGLNPTAHWSADAGQLLLTSTLATENGYQLHFRQMNPGSGLFETLDETLQITSEDFITIRSLFWFMP